MMRIHLRTWDREVRASGRPRVAVELGLLLMLGACSDAPATALHEDPVAGERAAMLQRHHADGAAWLQSLGGYFRDVGPEIPCVGAYVLEFRYVALEESDDDEVVVIDPSYFVDRDAVSEQFTGAMVQSQQLFETSSLAVIVDAEGSAEIRAYGAPPTAENGVRTRRDEFAMSHVLTAVAIHDEHTGRALISGAYSPADVGAMSVTFEGVVEDQSGFMRLSVDASRGHTILLHVAGDGTWTFLPGRADGP